MPMAIESTEKTKQTTAITIALGTLTVSPSTRQVTIVPRMPSTV